MNDEMKAFIENLYFEYRGYVYILAYQKLEDKNAAEEIVQETFVIAMKKAKKLYKHTNRKQWFIKTVNNKIMQYKRKDMVKIDGKNVFVKFIDILTSEAIDFVEKLSGNSVTYEFEENDELLEKVKPFLSDRELEFFSYKYIDDCKTSVICDKMGISYTNATTISNRISKKLKKFYESCDKSDKKKDLYYRRAKK